MNYTFKEYRPAELVRVDILVAGEPVDSLSMITHRTEAEGQARSVLVMPLISSWWESTTLPGVYFAGTIGQAAKGLVKHGVPANSGAVHGARYNATVLARRMATVRFGIDQPRPAVAPDRLVSTIAGELAEAPELWHQRAYLARVFTVDPAAGIVDDGVQPLTHFLDAGGHDAVAVTLEADGTGAIYPVLYTRVGGEIRERNLEPDPLLRYDGPDAQRQIAAIVADSLPGVAVTT